MKQCLVIFLVILCASVCFGQDEKAVEFEFDVQFATISLPFDGSEAEIISGQPMLGVKTDLELVGLQFSPGLYVAGNLSFNNGNESNWSIGPALYAEMLKGVGFGVVLEALVEGDGLGFNKERWALIVGYDINF